MPGTRRSTSDHIRPDADFIVDHGPSYGAERWEEHPGYSPSTIASEIAGLVAAAHLAQAAGRHRPGAPVPGHRRRLPAQREGLDGHHHRPRTATTATSSACRRPGDPNADRDLRPGQRQPDQRRPALGDRRRLPRADPDGRAARRRPGRPGLAARSSTRCSRARRAPAPAGTATAIQASGSTDGYGDCYVPDPTNCSPTGAPWFTHGRRDPATCGRCSTASAPSRTCRPATAAGASGLARDHAADDLGARATCPSRCGRTRTRPPRRTAPTRRPRRSASPTARPPGSATPLIWAQAQYLRLVRDLQTGKLPRPARRSPGRAT